MAKTNYSVTRYNKTRHFALTADGELLAVTVYRKGALNIINHIQTIMAKKHNHTVKAVDLNGATVRIMLNSNGELEICNSLRGEFKTEQVLPNGVELLTNGSYTPIDEKHAKLLKRMLNKQQDTDQPEEVEDATPEVEPEEAKAFIDSHIIIGAPGHGAAVEPEEEAPADEPVEEAAEAEPVEEATDEEEADIQHFIELEQQDAEAATSEAAEEEQEAPAEKPVEEPAPAPAAKPARAKACQYMMPGDTEPRNVEPDTKPVPGMTLIRKHKGKTVIVKVLENGFEWEGTVYPTLTHVSWKAADYHISGNAYFGLAVNPRKK